MVGEWVPLLEPEDEPLKGRINTVFKEKRILKPRLSKAHHTPKFGGIAIIQLSN